MQDTSGYVLTEQQKRQIASLLKLPLAEEDATFDSLQRLMNADAWFDIDEKGKVQTSKVTARRVRNFELLSRAFTKFAKELGKIDPVVLSHLDDQFSFFLFERTKPGGQDVISSRNVVPLKELLEATGKWAGHTSISLKEKGGTGYLDRFYSEIDHFLYWNFNGSVEWSNAVFSKLIAILLNIDEDDAGRQLRRWKRMNRGEDKTPI